MALSNTAVPVYYGQFREEVLAGRIPVCREIAMQMNRIDERVKDPRFYYDDSAIDGFVKFCENELTLTDGSDLVLLDTFKLWAEDLLAWFYFVERQVYVPDEDNPGIGHYVRKKIKRRLTTKQFLIVSRGSAKSMYLACLQAYGLNIDPATTAEIEEMLLKINQEEGTTILFVTHNLAQARRIEQAAAAAPVLDEQADIVARVRIAAMRRIRRRAAAPTGRPPRAHRPRGRHLLPCGLRAVPTR